MRYLITGGAGFIGSNLAEFLLETRENPDIVVLDKLTYAGDKGNLASILDKIEFYEADICNRELISDLYEDVDVAVNLAAESHVDRSIQSGEPFVESNVKGAFVMMDEMRNASVEKLVHMSTDEVYGSISEGSSVEGDKLNPSSPYSASKAAADMFFHAFRTTYDLPITVARCTNVFGPRQHPEKFIPTMIKRALNDEDLPIYGDGSNRREWIFVEDVSWALQTIIEDASAGIYNIDGGEEKDNMSVAKMILDILDKPEDLISFVEDRKGHDFRYSLNHGKLREETGWEPQTGFGEGLEQTVGWYRENF